VRRETLATAVRLVSVGLVSSGISLLGFECNRRWVIAATSGDPEGYNFLLGVFVVVFLVHPAAVVVLTLSPLVERGARLASIVFVSPAPIAGFVFSTLFPSTATLFAGWAASIAVGVAVGTATRHRAESRRRLTG